MPRRQRGQISFGAHRNRPRTGSVSATEFRWKHNEQNHAGALPAFSQTGAPMHVYRLLAVGGHHGSASTSADLRLVRKLRIQMQFKSIQSNSSPPGFVQFYVGLMFDRDGLMDWSSSQAAGFSTASAPGDVTWHELFTRQGGLILNRKPVQLIQSKQFDTYAEIDLRWPKFNLNDEREMAVYFYKFDTANYATGQNFTAYALQAQWVETVVSR